MAYFDLKINLA